MRVLHVETGRNLYGGALQVLYLLKGLKERGVSSTLVCAKGADIARAAEGYADAIHAVPMRGDLDLPFIFRLNGLIRREAPDILHLHSRRGADVLGGISSLITRTKCVLTRRVDNPEPRFLAGIKYKMYDRVMTISEGIKEVMLSEGVPPGKVSCVRSAVDTSEYVCQGDTGWFMDQFDLKEGEVPVGMVAQFIERKGHRHLIHAAPGILSEHPEVRFLFFGRGPLEDEIKKLAADEGVNHAVKFCGFRDDLHRILPCLFALVHPASMEGLGVSLLQAAASCVPIAGAGPEASMRWCGMALTGF